MTEFVIKYVAALPRSNWVWQYYREGHGHTTDISKATIFNDISNIVMSDNAYVWHPILVMEK